MRKTSGYLKKRSSKETRVRTEEKNEMKNVKIDYQVGGYDKFLIGTLKEETDDFFIIISRDGFEWRIAKQTVREIREYAP